MPPWYQRFTIGAMILVITLVSVVGTFGFIEPAHAQLPVGILTSIPAVTQTTLDQIWQGLKSALLNAASRIISYAMRKIAYDGAVWLASGGKGQTPFAQTKGFGDYLKNVGDDALGHGIDALGSKFGMNLCKLPNIQSDLALRMGLRTGFQTPGIGGIGGGAGGTDPSAKPACTFSEFTKNWGDSNAWKSKFDTAQQSMTEQLNSSLNFTQGGGGGLQTVLDTKDKINQLVQSQTLTKQLSRQEGQGYTAKTALISGQIQTPPGVIKKEFESNTPGDLQAKDEAQIQALLTTGDIKVIPNVLSMFLNTLVSTMVKNYQEKGILPFGLGCKSGSEGCLAGETANTFEGTGFVSNRAAAQDLFSSFLTVKIGAEDSYDILSELGNCEGKGVYNCRADQGLIQAARQTAGGQSVTIANALKAEGGTLLHGDWKLIPYKNREADNAHLQQFCQKAYCEANIKVLRQIRLLPLGFEIAAHNSDPDRPWTLAAVVAGFNNCNYKTIVDINGNTVKTVIPDPKYPFCHLIDPNWVLKVPESRCNAKVNSSVQLTKDAPTRLEDCVDLSSCVAYNSDGSCANYSYCTREKNSWDFGPADKCDAQWRSCQSYQNVDTGATVNYLQRSLDTGSCGQSDVGCRAYSLDQSVFNGAKQWNRPATIIAQNTFTQQSIFFNNKLPKSCSANSAGCTAFQVASSTLPGQDLRYLRKAPDYLGCYDSNGIRADGVQWPQSTTDLNSLSKDVACNTYAGACTAEEVGCAMYTNKNSGDSVPGKVSQDNVCSADCVGYNAYQEMPSHYSNGQSVTYAVIQPGTGAQCAKSEVGCSSFTNLSTATGGQENIEYYSYLRPCELRDKKPTKIFNTFEGATQGGFQLLTYTLVADANGAPAQWTKVPGDALEYVSGPHGCNETNYKTRSVTSECRQFNDEAGKSYYALLDKTIPVTDQCTPYRLNSSELNPQPDPGQVGGLNAVECSAANGYWDGSVCQLCFQNGEFKDGFCNYWGLPDAVQNTAHKSQSCSAEVESCREYRGNEGFNVKIFPTDTFEVTTTAAVWQWSGTNLKLSKESTHAGEQSLGVVGNNVVATRMVSSTVGQSYLVTFWAKGTVNTLSVALAGQNNIPSILGTASISDTWQQYSFGPILYDGPGENARITFSLLQNGALFIDNFSVQQINGVEYRVKNKLTVPLSCDADPTDNLPGAALGCSLYTSPQMVGPVPLTGFDFLCRDKAIGCAAFIDTHNTLAKQDSSGDDGTAAHLYKVFLPGDGSAAKWDLYYNGFSIANCRTGQGDLGCTVDLIGMEPTEVLTNTLVNNKANAAPVFTPSTVFIPADATTTPIYLVNNPKLAGQCSQADIGCVSVGEETQTPTGPKYATTTIKNDPAAYTNTLCQQESVGCSAWSDTKGGTSYFRDPTVVGQKLCEFKVDQPTELGAKVSGWMWKDVGKCWDLTKLGQLCSASSDCGVPKTCSIGFPITCTADSDCAGVPNSKCVESCRDVGAVACYDKYVDNNGKFGLWSYGDKGKYDNFVGVCPAEKNGCTEYVDHNDIDVNGSSHAEYFIKDDKITSGDCNGSVSQKAGCALFDETSNPSKYWSTKATYDLSNASDGVAVKPVVSVANDANTLLKVQPNRQCGEWIQCRQSFTVWDPTSGRPKSVCQEIGRCAEADPVNPAECSKWVDGVHALAGNVLDEGTYVARRADWSTLDFSGFSIIDQFPVEEFEQINISVDASKPDWRLVKNVLCGGGKNCFEKKPDSKSSACGAQVSKKGDAECGLSAEGRCYNGRCIRAIIATAPKEMAKNLKEQTQICRAYPESDSPFPNSPEMDKVSGGGSQLFATVKICNENRLPQNNPALANLCECDYTKVKYGDSLVKYWNYSKAGQTEQLYDAAKIPGRIPPGAPDPKNLLPKDEMPSGICLGGNKEDAACAADEDCYTVDKNDPTKTIPTGSCQIKKAQNNYLGWRGFCLEYDMSQTINGAKDMHPCLTWYPIDTLSGAADISSQHVEAGYRSGTNPLYCLNSNGGSIFDINNQQGWLNKKLDTNAALSAVYSDTIYAKLSSGSFEERLNDVYYGDSTFPFFPLQGQMFRHRVKIGDFGAIFSNWKRPIYLQDLEKIVFTIFPNADRDNNDPAHGTVFEMYPVDFTAQDTEPQNTYKVKIDDDSWGQAATGRYLGRPYEPFLFYGGAFSDPRKDFAAKFLSSDGKKVCYGKANNEKCEALNGNLFSSANAIDIWKEDKSLNEKLCPYAFDTVPGDLGGNWHALRLHFDPLTNELLWYDTAYCDNSINSGEVQYSITVKFKEWCQVLGDSTSPAPDPSQPNQTVAWTDRVWKDNKRANRFKFDDFELFGLFNYTVDVDGPAFGKLSTPKVKNQLTLTPFVNYGMKAVCPKSVCGHLVDPDPGFTNGAPYSCSQGSCVRMAASLSEGAIPVAPARSKADGRKFAGSLFAQFMQTFDFDTTLINAPTMGLKGYSSKVDATGYPETGDPNTLEPPKAPRVNPLVPGTCQVGGELKGQCVEDPMVQGGITINDRPNGEIKVFNPGAKVYIKFYMHADDNQMPIRSVSVDWNNDQVVEPRTGYFYNQRGLVTQKCYPIIGPLQPGEPSGICAHEVNGKRFDSQQKCNKDSECTALEEQCSDPGTAPSFGYIKSEDAEKHITCDSHYYETYNAYNCTRNDPNYTANACGSDPDQFPQGCCVYKPKVQIKDNWGWCNGTCDPISKGCYDDATRNGKCSQPQAWTQFAGTVIVAPTGVK